MNHLIAYYVDRLQTLLVAWAPGTPGVSGTIPVSQLASTPGVYHEWTDDPAPGWATIEAFMERASQRLTA